MLLFLSLLISSLFALKLYLKWCCGKCTSRRDMSGKTVIITGANTGIGRESALDMAKRGARVILACRDSNRANEAREFIRISTGNPNVLVQLVDLSLMHSVKRFAEKIIATESRIDVLICNAGMTPPPGKIHRTSEGLEVQYASNILGHFLMIHLLQDLIKKSSPSRIIFVSSCTHLWAPFSPNNMNSERNYVDPYFVYCNTKLVSLLLTTELSRRLADTGVTVNALHPGAVLTDIARNAHWYIRNVFIPVMYCFLKTPLEGAQTIIHLAVSEEVEHVTGKYFVDCEEYWVSKRAKDPELAQYVWAKCEQVLGLADTAECKQLNNDERLCVLI